MKRTLLQNRKFYTLIHQLGLSDDVRRDLVSQYTNKRTVHSSEMTVSEMNRLLKALSETQQKMSPGYVSKNDKLRKTIISIFREMNYHNEAGKADMERIQGTVSKIWGKRLNDYTSDELSTIIAVLKRDWIPHYYKKENAKSKS